MPIHDYICLECGYIFTIITRYDNFGIPSCENCGSNKVGKKYSPPIVIYKGSGFYSTDNKNG